MDPRRSIDLNGDVGEGMPNDPELIPLLTSANIACGAHAGNVETMRCAVACALAAGVAIGAHPSFPDRGHFGRREMAATPTQIRGWLQEQIGALQLVAAREGARIRHVKPHGALYNLAARDPEIADAVALSVRAIDSTLALFVLAGSELAHAAVRAGLRAIPEGFCDRAYRLDGTLAPRTLPGAVIEDDSQMVRQALSLARGEPIEALGGGAICPQVETLCLHGDGADAVVFAKRLRAELAQAGIALRHNFPASPLL